MEDWLPGSDLLYSFEDGLPDLGDASEWPDWLATADLLPASPNSVSNQLFAPPELPVASTSTVSSCQEGLPGSTQASGSAGIPLETVPDVPVTHASHQDERAGGSSQRDKDNNSKEGNSQQKKAGKKRGAAVMDGSDPTASGQHLPACDGCRIRRIKCVRMSDDIHVPCNACEKKHINCVLTPRKRKPYKDRGGQRLELARAQCGPDTEAVSATTRHEAEMSELDLSFVNLYYDTMRLASPLVRWRQLRSQLEKAKWRLDEMDEMATILMKALKVFGALISNRPEVLGEAGAPSVHELELFRGQDLSKFGRARQAFCRKLLDEAVVALESAGTFRQITAEASTAFLLFQRLEIYLECSQTTLLARPYLNAATSIFRDLNGELLNFQPGVVFVAGWHLLQEDAMWAAWRARDLTISDYLMIRIAHPFTIGNSMGVTMDSLKRDVQSTEPLVFLKPLIFLWMSHIGANRALVQDITLVIARKSTLPTEAFHAAIRKYTGLLATSRVIASELPPLIPPHILERQKARVSLHLDTQLAATIYQLHHYLLLLRKDVQYWLVHHPPRDGDNLASERAEAATLCDVLDGLLREAAADIAAHLRGAPLEEAVLVNSTAGRFAEWLPVWADITLDTPVDQAMSYEQKVANARTIIDSIIVQSYVWPAKWSEAQEYLQRYEKLRDAGPTASPSNAS